MLTHLTATFARAVAAMAADLAPARKGGPAGEAEVLKALALLREQSTDLMMLPLQSR